MQIDNRSRAGTAVGLLRRSVLRRRTHVMAPVVGPAQGEMPLSWGVRQPVPRGTWEPNAPITHRDIANCSTP